MDDQIRAADKADLLSLDELEDAADERFTEWGIDLSSVSFDSADSDSAQNKPGLVLVIGRPPVAFARAEWVDGNVHLAELAVHPNWGRRGLGGQLLEAVCFYAARAGARAVTLTTFREVPWNGPWYARRGFVELPCSQWGEELTALVRSEHTAGLEVAPRLVMRRWVSSPDCREDRPATDY
jgi:GNAT superfamily N-acetyltransferase